MHWNYRVVFMEDDKWGDQWHELREVFYNEAGEPVGHSATTVMGDSPEEINECLQNMGEAVTKPVMKRNDFVGKFVDLDIERREGDE